MLLEAQFAPIPVGTLYACHWCREVALAGVVVTRGGNRPLPEPIICSSCLTRAQAAVTAPPAEPPAPRPDVGEGYCRAPDAETLRCAWTRVESIQGGERQRCGRGGCRRERDHYPTP